MPLIPLRLLVSICDNPVYPASPGRPRSRDHCHKALSSSRRLRRPQLGLEGIVSKRLDAPYVPGNRGLWLKTKRLNREEFMVVGWTDPEGTRRHLGAPLLAYHDPDGRLTYAGRGNEHGRE